MSVIVTGLHGPNERAYDTRLLRWGHLKADGRFEPDPVDGEGMSQCALCHDDITERASVRVSFDGDVRDVCDSCMEKADEGEPIDVALDMTREGLPEFNGAFNAW